MAEVDKDIIKKINEIVSLLQFHNITIRSVYLYGSFARGTAGEWSDIDIAIVSDDFSKNRIDERIRLMKITSNIDSRIEPVPFRTEHFDESDPLVWEIKNTGIQIPLH